jgi:hypothetical protein
MHDSLRRKMIVLYHRAVGRNAKFIRQSNAQSMSYALHVRQA